MGVFGPLAGEFNQWKAAAAGNPNAVFGARYGNEAGNMYGLGPSYDPNWQNDPSKAAQVQAYSDQTFGAPGQSRPTLGRLNGGGVVRQGFGQTPMGPQPRGVFGQPANSWGRQMNRPRW